MDNLIKRIPIYTATLFFIIALKMQFLGNALHMPLNNFLNFSNLLTNTFDFIDGSLPFISLIIIVNLFKTRLKLLIAKWHWWIIIVAIVVCGGVVGITYYAISNMTYWLNIGLKLTAEIGLFFLGIFTYKYFRNINLEYVQLFLVAMFIFMYLKINLRYELDATLGTAGGSKVTIVLKDDTTHQPKTYKGFITNTVEFIIINETANGKVTVIPVAEIQSMSF